MIELPIEPFTLPASGIVSLPGSKSITNRAIILAALSDGPVTLRDALFSDDTSAMLTALEDLGFNLTTNELDAEINIEGLSGNIPCNKTKIHVGNSGTVARFLTAFLCLKKNGHYNLDGDDAIRKRPMGGLLDVLIEQGAEVIFEGEEGHFPFLLKTHGLKGGLIEVNARASSQFLSALLMVAPFTEQDATIRRIDKKVRKSFIHLTHKMMESWNQKISTDHETMIKARGRYSINKDDYIIEPDATAASYFIVLPLITGGEITIKGASRISNSIHLNLQGDTRFADILINENLISNSRHGDTHFLPGSSRHGIDQNFYEFSDTFMTIAAIAPLLESRTRITGIGHTRHQETDRIAAMATELRKLGQEVIEEDDALEILPSRSSLIEKAKEGVTIETYKDHRIAMSFAVLGCADLKRDGRPWMSIIDPYCCAKTFPNFFDVLNELRENSLINKDCRSGG